MADGCGRWRLLRSKEAITVIVWYAVISLWLQGEGFAPAYMFNRSSAGQWTYAVCIALSYPIIGLMADMWIGRYKIITFSLWLKWATVVVVTLISSLVVIYQQTLMAGTVSDVLVIILTIVEQVGFSTFQVTAIQFGTDQLQDAPRDQLSSFIFWYICVEQVATPIVEWVNFSLYLPKTITELLWALTGWCMIVASLLTLVLVVKNCFMTRWFVREPGTPNPYRLVYHVVKFAWKHKHPVQRSALSDQEEKPSRLDYGKCKYGGPFLNEEVENVKILFRLSAVLFSLLGIFILIFSLQDNWQTLVLNHIGGRTSHNSLPFLLEAASDTVVLGLLIPLHELVIYPLFQKYIPSMVKRILIGAALYLCCALSIFLLDLVGHVKNRRLDCFYFFPLELSDSTETLDLSSYYVLIPNILYGVATIIFHVSLIEFIVLHSPHSMKGMLLGTYYTVRYGVTEAFPLSLQYAFAYHNSNHPLSCASSYYLMLLIIGLISLILFILVSYKLRNWKRSEEIDIHSFIEDGIDQTGCNKYETNVLQ